MATTHLHEELAQISERVSVETRYGTIKGGRAANGSAVFLEVPFALPPVRFEDPKPLPESFRYEDREYIEESCYAVQPTNDGQAAGTPLRDKLGLGKPTENPLFVNIIIPPSFPSAENYSVKVYIHGGYLQFGSPHGLYSQSQYVAAERNEVHVNIGYRLSVFGFLAADNPSISGNFGFKDQWLALLWIKENIASFGGNPNDIQLSGLSAGAHSVHQILHHASRLPEGEKAPFNRAVLQSNSIATNPKTPAQLQPQFEAFCKGLGLDPHSPDILSTLRDPAKVPTESIVKCVESLDIHGTFRGCMDGTWMADSPDPMTWQRSGGFADGLRRVGVKSIVIGDLSEEWYIYSLSDPITTASDIWKNLRRYYSDDLILKIKENYKSLPDDANVEDSFRLFGEILSDIQVHLAVRILARDLIKSNFPVLRYEIRWTPEQRRVFEKGYVSHATDRALWVLRTPVLTPQQAEIARHWLKTIDNELYTLEAQGRTTRGVKEMLTLKDQYTVEWSEDSKYDQVIRLAKMLPGEI